VSSINSSLIPFDFEGRQLRVFTDEQGSPWFVAVDVCNVLGIGNTSDALGRLDEDEKTLVSIEGGPDLNLVNEPGLYGLVLGSRKPEAKGFKRWITHEVLPAIRKTGSYSVPKESDRGKVSRTHRRPSLSLIRRALEPFKEHLSEVVFTRLVVEATVTNYPELEATMLPGLAMLPAVDVKEKTYTPTEIGQMVAQQMNRMPFSPQWINHHLSAWGLQRKDVDGKWVATEEAHAYAVMDFVRIQGGPTSSCKVHTKQQLRWKAALVNHIIPLVHEVVC
jgi:prophage antirepressor-like protein